MTARLSSQALGSALGRAAGPLIGLAARARGARALHPRGAVVPGRLVRVRHAPTGVPWLDEDRDVDVTVRLSRSVGLPAPLPDVLGLAMRCPLSGAVGDLLLSSTPATRLARHVFVPRRQPLRTHYSCAIPFRTPAGYLMVGAAGKGGLDLDLAWARLGGPWTTFARLQLLAADGPDDAGLDLDPVLHPLPGLDLPAALARLRQPAYEWSRRGRGRSSQPCAPVPVTRP